MAADGEAGRRPDAMGMAASLLLVKHDGARLTDKA